MSENKLEVKIRRVSPFANAIDIRGEITSFTETTLFDAYEMAIQGNIRSLIFNFSEMDQMNSFGIGMLIRLLVRAQREGKKFVGYGLNDHYRKIFELTRIDQAIPIYLNEETAIASAEPMDHIEREN